MNNYMRKLMLVIADIIIINIAFYISMFLKFDGSIPPIYIKIFLHSHIIVAVIKMFVYYLFGLYRSLWQYASIGELVQVLFATLVGSGLHFVFGHVFDMSYPNSLYMISWVMTFVMVGGVRLSYRMARLMLNINNIVTNNKIRVMIVGAGSAGATVIRELNNHKQLNMVPVVAIDDDKCKYGSKINGVRIVGDRNKIQKAAVKYRIDEIIVAIPAARKSEISSILEICKQTHCKLKTLPGVYEIIDEKVSIKDIRDVNVEDLLGRDEVELDTSEIAGYITNEVILVTGGGGSIGSEICRQIARFKPKKLIIFDIYENNAYELQNELLCNYKDELELQVLIGTVRDKNRLEDVFKTYKPGVVFHAAAHKHVPLMEANPAEAVKNNVIGTLNVAQCSARHNAKRFVLISTDKAVNPTNIMGASKRMAEMIVQSMDKHSRTEFAAVRFGNVLGSNGSVIPLFKKQIAQGGPVTVTHPDITRYFMTIPEAARLVIQAGAMAKGGEIFILDMGKPVKITDLAQDLIKLSGLKPGVDIDIKYTGLRPGEKLYEELLLDEEGIKGTTHDKIFVGKPLNLSYKEVMMCVKALENSLSDAERLRDCMKRVVPTYICAFEEVAAAYEGDTITS